MTEISAPILVYAKKVGSTFQFTAASAHWDNDKTLAFSCPKADDYVMTFVLIPGDTNLRFVNSADQAFWSKIGSYPGNCPTTAGNESDFEPRSVELEGKMLRVLNRNDNKLQHCFTLRFRDEDDHQENTIYPWDPIIDNQNGEDLHFRFTLHLLHLIAIIGGGALVGAVAMRLIG